MSLLAAFSVILTHKFIIQLQEKPPCSKIRVKMVYSDQDGKDSFYPGCKQLSLKMSPLRRSSSMVLGQIMDLAACDDLMGVSSGCTIQSETDSVITN